MNGAYGGFQVFANPNWQTVTFGMRPMIAGDTNQDGLVNGLDIANVASHWLQIGPGTPGDANGDRVVNGLDIALISANWLNISAGATSVPEPSTIVLATLGVIALLAYRWRIA